MVKLVGKTTSKGFLPRVMTFIGRYSTSKYIVMQTERKEAGRIQVCTLLYLIDVPPPPFLVISRNIKCLVSSYMYKTFLEL
jgi:hypothetical protein